MDLNQIEHAANRARVRELNAYLDSIDRAASRSEAAYLEAADDVAADGDGAEALTLQIVDDFADLRALVVSAARMSGIPRHLTTPVDDTYLGLCFRRLVRRELDAYCTKQWEKVS